MCIWWNHLKKKEAGGRRRWGRIRIEGGLYRWVANHSDASYRNYTARVHLNAINNTPLIVSRHLAGHVFLSMRALRVSACARTTTRLERHGPRTGPAAFLRPPASFLTVLLSFFLFSKRRLHRLLRAPIKFAGCSAFISNRAFTDSNFALSRSNFVLISDIVRKKLMYGSVSISTVNFSI